MVVTALAATGTPWGPVVLATVYLAARVARVVATRARQAPVRVIQYEDRGTAPGPPRRIERTL